MLTDEIVFAALAFIEEAEANDDLRQLERARRIRNGLMMGVLALAPVRARGFGELRIGSTFVRENGCWWIRLKPPHTKSRRRDERPIHSLLTHYLDRWVETYLTVFRRRGDALWPSIKGGALCQDQVYTVICETTEQTLGLAMTPHMIRTSAGSSAARYAPHNPYLGPAILHHHGRRSFEAAYERVSSMHAGLALQDIVLGLSDEQRHHPARRLASSSEPVTE